MKGFSGILLFGVILVVTQVAHSATDNDMKKAAVDEHNKYRRMHKVQDVRGDEKVHRSAQQWADYLASTNKFEHTPKNKKKYGENLARNSEKNKVAAVRAAIKQWYDEVKLYKYNKPGFSMATGHFTQLIWKKSTHIGIGVARNPKLNQYIVVAQYNPSGNVQGQFPENVPRRG